MTARCDLTELLVDSCSHCLGQDKPDVVDLDGITVEHVIRAIYGGRCALDGRHQIEVGDRIGRTDHGWICASCMGRAS